MKLKQLLGGGIALATLLVGVVIPVTVHAVETGSGKNVTITFKSNLDGAYLNFDSLPDKSNIRCIKHASSGGGGGGSSYGSGGGYSGGGYSGGGGGGYYDDGLNNCIIATMAVPENRVIGTEVLVIPRL